MMNRYENGIAAGFRGTGASTRLRPDTGVSSVILPTSTRPGQNPA